MGCPVVHWEFWSQQPQQLSNFYARVFGWSMRELPEMNYTLVETGAGGCGGGIMQPQKGPWPGNMTFYIDVDQLEGYAQRVKDAGGKILVERMDVPGVGSFMLFEDPDGRVLGMWQRLK